MTLRIVYVMNVDWDWAKQRPHFIALHLSRLYEVVVLYPFSWRRGHLSKNERDGVKLFPFFCIPFGGKIALIRMLNSIVLRVMAKFFLNTFKPNIVWIASPEFSCFIPKSLPACLIYDCMDDVLAFPSNKDRKDILAANEQKLIDASSHVFCSSNNLRDKLLFRSGNSGKYSVVNNACEPASFFCAAENTDVKSCSGRSVLGYVGTISSWMDFEILLKIVEEFASIEIHFMGPFENLKNPLPQHERIKYLGVVRHREVQLRISEFDALVMPFKVTDLVLSVDPVKLYEYILFNKPIVSVRYPGVERFSGFVDFYSNYVEFAEIVTGYLNTGFTCGYSIEARDQFIADNTWAQRVASIKSQLSQCVAANCDR